MIKRKREVKVTVEKAFQNKREEDLKRIQGLRLLDDDFMTRVLEDRQCAELVIRIVLDSPGLVVTEAHTQYTMKNLQGRSARLDVLACDAQKRMINIEVQRSDKGAGARRARYNGSLIDANSIAAGENVEELPDSYVIFITEHDLYHKGMSVYHINRIIQETGTAFEDGLHILYVNGQSQENSAVGILMRDFNCTDPDDMHYELLAERVRFYKEDEKGVEVMCRAFEEVRQEGIRTGRVEGEKKKAQEMALAMLRAGESREKIRAYSGLTDDEIDAVEQEACCLA